MANRRGFIRTMGLSATGSLISYPFNANSAPSFQIPSSSQVSLVTGTDRRKMVQDVLLPFKDIIKNGIQGKQIIIKPNVVEPFCPLAVTSIDTLRGLLDFLSGLTDQKIIIGDASCTPSRPGGRLTVNNTMQNFLGYGYDNLTQTYNVKLIDFNSEPSTTVNWTVAYNTPKGDVIIPMNISSYFLDKNNYFISLANMKTHLIAVCSLSTKNFCMSSPLNFLVKIPENIPTDYVSKWIFSEKNKIHLGSYKGINYNIVRIARHIQPEFAIIDGVVGMEGDGPTIYGKPINHGVMLAGPDMISVDRIGIELMGLDYNTIKYVQYCSLAGVGQGDIEKIEILGPNMDNYRKKYQLPSTFQQQTSPIAWTRNEPAEIPEFSTPLEIDNELVPGEFFITLSNSPNPFNALTEIHLTLSRDDRFSLSIYSANGQCLKNFASMYFNKGEHLIIWDGTDNNGKKVSSGVYIAGIITKNKIFSHRMMLIK
jgi:uncharacterized protein (DUF362 family)